MIEVPEIKYSKWTRWSDRSEIQGLEYPGIYLLAYFNGTPPRKTNPRSKDVLYIGETCSNSLRGRLRQFNRSAFEGKSGHSGGKTYSKLVGGRGRNLFVSVISANWLDENTRPQLIRYIERKLIWEYTFRWGLTPKCNRK